MIDIEPLRSGRDAGAVEAAIDAACREVGFFSIWGHGVDRALADDLEREARRFFALPDTTKAAIAMARGGRSWRGWFPVGGELTSGRPDLKEGLYFGEELPPTDPRVVEGRPLHGPNLVPAAVPLMRPLVLEWIDAMAGVARAVLRGVAGALGVGGTWFEDHLTGSPTTLFRIFHYPPSPPSGSEAGWGVAEHTDYGLLTVLRQDSAGGLQVHGRRGWIDVPPDPDTFVCNIGDMLDRMTGGLYRSTPHRVRNTSGRSRLSFPYFFDPGWDAVVTALPAHAVADGPGGGERWDGADVHAWSGTYGEYLTGKVARVFPDLFASTVDAGGDRSGEGPPA